MLNFEEFCNHIKNNIVSYLNNQDEVREVRLLDIEKPGQTLTSLNVVLDGTIISPNFYLDPLYHEYNIGEKSLDDILKLIANHYCWNDGPAIDFDFVDEISDFDRCKDRIVFRLIPDSAEYEPYLQSRVHMSYGDSDMNLAMIFDVDVSNAMGELGNCDDGTAQTAVSESLMNCWKKNGTEVTLDMIKEAAMENTPRIRPAQIINLDDIVCEMFNMDEEIKRNNAPIFVVTNNKQYHGAAAILYKNVYQNVYEDLCAKLGEDIYIMPSSAHEVIVVPQSFTTIGELYKINSDVNREQITDKSDFLATDVYVIKDGQLKSVAKEYKDEVNVYE